VAACALVEVQFLLDLVRSFGIDRLLPQACLLGSAFCPQAKRIWQLIPCQLIHLVQVKKVNGIEVRNLRHLRRLVEGCKEKFVRFDLDDERVMVLNFEEAKRASEGILSSHRIPSHISEDLEEDRFGDSEDVADTTWPDQVTEHQAIPVENRTNSKL
jgi:hypothetical protein